MSEVAAAAATPRAGQPRSVGLVILLYIVTFGIYGLYWYYVTFDEMKKETNDGLGGVLALIITVVIGIVMPFITGHEIAKMYEKAGKTAPVSPLTGLWFFPGMFIIVGPFIWIIKVQGALNRYWEAQA